MPLLGATDGLDRWRARSVGDQCHETLGVDATPPMERINGDFASNTTRRRIVIFFPSAVEMAISKRGSERSVRCLA
jgi:hypothetical protein